MTENTRQQEREAHAQMAMGAARMHRKFTYHNTQDAREEALVDTLMSSGFYSRNGRWPDPKIKGGRWLRQTWGHP